MAIEQKENALESINLTSNEVSDQGCIFLNSWLKKQCTRDVQHSFNIAIFDLTFNKIKSKHLRKLEAQLKINRKFQAERMKVKFAIDIKDMSAFHHLLRTNLAQQQVNIEELKNEDEELRLLQTESQKKMREWDFDFQRTCAKLENFEQLEVEAYERLNALKSQIPKQVQAELAEFRSKKKEIHIRIDK